MGVPAISQNAFPFWMVKCTSLDFHQSFLLTVEWKHLLSSWEGGKDVTISLRFLVCHDLLDSSACFSLSFCYSPRLITSLLSSCFLSSFLLLLINQSFLHCFLNCSGLTLLKTCYILSFFFVITFSLLFIHRLFLFLSLTIFFCSFFFVFLLLLLLTFLLVLCFPSAQYFLNFGFFKIYFFPFSWNTNSFHVFHPPPFPLVHISSLFFFLLFCLSVFDSCLPPGFLCPLMLTLSRIVILNTAQTRAVQLKIQLGQILRPRN